MNEAFRVLKPQFESALNELLGAWFPRAIDGQSGGYLCDFDHRWKLRRPNHRMLEYQARTLAFLSLAAQRDEQLTPFASHGYEFLRDVMWDTEFGCWYRMVDHHGEPLENAVKHGHGVAYAISALSRYYALTGDSAALCLAEEAFEWMETYAYDRQHGGYFSYMQRDGTLILNPVENPGHGGITDPLGNPIGYKESNTLVDMLEALGELYEVSRNQRVHERLDQLLGIVLNQAIVEPGCQHLAFTRDWRPVPNLTIYAMCLQTASRVLRASRACNDGSVHELAVAKSRSLIDNVVRAAWDPERGGFYHAGWAFGTAEIVGFDSLVRDKTWWCQAEGLRALAELVGERPDTPYGSTAVQLWRYIDHYVIDKRHGGWQERGRDSVRFDKKAPKASVWKDMSHEGAALIRAIEAIELLEAS